jgi:hypothetical protein
MPLAPLYSVETGQVIPNFPDSTQTIRQLPSIVFVLLRRDIWLILHFQVTK